MTARSRPLNSILEAVGQTPLIRLNRVARGIRTPVLAKAEQMNPGGSVKDRIGLAIIEAAERSGALKPGGTIVEGTSGNTGVGLAIAAAIKGYRCVFTIPDKMSSEKIKLLRAFGAEVVVVPTAVPPRPSGVLHPEGEGHRRVGRFLKEKNPTIRVIAPDPIGSIYTEYAKSHTKGEGFPYKVEGIGGDKIPTSLDFGVVDEFVQVGDKEAFRMARRLTREEGLFVGGSTGMNVHVALDVARRLDDPAALVVTILCDTGERYISKVYDDEWMRANQMLDTMPVTVEALIAQHPAGIPPLVSVAPAASVRQALNLMSTYGISQVPVIAGNDCVGSVTEGPVISRALEDAKLLERAVSDVMQPPFPVVDAALPIERLNTLLSHETQAALVRKDGRLVGIVTRYDVLRQIAGIR
jgi:cystathionine beta-synthase